MNYQSLYNIYKQYFDDGELCFDKLTTKQNDSHIFRHFLLNFIQRLDVDSWLAQDKFQASLILSYFHVNCSDYENEISDLSSYPLRIDFDDQLVVGENYRFTGQLRFIPSFSKYPQG
jgi:hypothetical protein